MKGHFVHCVIILFLSLLLQVLFPQYGMAQGINRIQEIVVETNVEDSSENEGYKTLVKNLCGLQVGNSLSTENISHAILTLWKAGIFSDIRINREAMENGFRAIIRVDILPTIHSFKLEGFKEYKNEEILTSLKLAKGMAIGDRKVAKMRKNILDLYHEKGFLSAIVDFELTPLPPDSTKVDVKISINEGKKAKIKSIRITGNEKISDKKLKKAMKETKEDRWYRSGEFKEDAFEEDKRNLIHLYKSEGYRDATVLLDSLYTDADSGKINIMLFVFEGEQYKFGKTFIEGNTFFGDDELVEKLNYKEGETFNEDMLLYSIYGMEGIVTLYNDEGYLKTVINPIQNVRGDSIDVYVDIAEGTVSKVSRVIVEGNTKTIDKVIRREITLDPGMNFSRTLLERSKRDILALNFFQDVNYDYEPHTDSDDVDIKFKVTEKQTGMVNVGAGYSERDNLVGQLSIANQNLFGRGQSINFNWDTGSRRKAFQIGFSEPWLFDTPTSCSFYIYNMIRSDYTSAFDEEKRKGVSLSLGRRLDKLLDYSRASITYRLEDVDYSNPSDYYNYYLITGKTSSLRFMLLRDSRDLPQFATEGAQTSGIIEIAGGPLGGDLSYYKYLFNNEMYTPVIWNISLILRTRLGFLKGYKENTFVPYSERFMPGGTSYDGFVRGYPNRQVCPRLGGEEVGGETMAINNLELQIPIVAQTLYGILFYDFGNSWQNLSETNPFDMKRSVGMGARVFVPGIGLIGFDFGYGFDKIEGSDKVGGWRTHFQFGNMQYLY